MTTALTRARLLAVTLGLLLNATATVSMAQTLPPPLQLPPIQAGTTFTVTTNTDTNDGVCDDHCTLREAILAANASPNGALPALADRIEFRLPLVQQLVIQPQSVLPQLTDFVVVDGSNQPTTQLIFINGRWIDFTIQHPGNVELRGSTGAATGLRLAAGGALRDLVVTNFGTTGIELSTGGSKTLENLTVRGNGTGINVNGTSASLRTSTVTQNSTGVRLSGGQNTVAGNSIIGNTGVGIVVAGASNTIGGTTAAARNVISGNGAGISISFSAGNTRIVGNFIGVDATGAAALPNTGDGISIALTTVGTTIGGPTAAERNVISGNGGDGIAMSFQLSPAPGTTLVQNNLIGTNPAGAAGVPNAGTGVRVTGPIGTGIDDISPRAHIIGNVISGNRENGVLLFGGARHLVQSDFIGTDATGNVPLGNGTNGQFHGLFLQDARLVLVGGDTAALGNVIANNANSGVTVFTPTPGSLTAVGNAIRSNRIFNNGRLGIDLAEGNSQAGFGIVTNNDASDIDSGPNRTQNFPELSAATSGASGLTVQGTLNSTSAQTFVVEFFASPTCDIRGAGEGAQLLGSVQVSTNGSGTTPLAAAFSTAPSTGVVTATATALATGDTSEFSICRTITAG